MFLSHLSGLILENTTSSIHVNEIKVGGLGDDFYMIQEQSPRIDYFAKSAPRLIVERLSKREDGYGVNPASVNNINICHLIPYYIS